MARHRKATLAWSHARHRGTGHLEHFVQRGRYALVASAASIMLVTALVVLDPVFEHQL